VTANPNSTDLMAQVTSNPDFGGGGSGGEKRRGGE